MTENALTALHTGRVMKKGFNIELLTEEPSDLQPEERTSYGLIQVGDLEERFVASLSFWKREDYRRHWIHALGRIVGSADRSCLITSITDPASSNFIWWWPLYRHGRNIYVQHQILFLEQLDGPFDPEEPYPHVPPRRSSTEDGERVSEWQSPIEAMEEFLLRASQRTNGGSSPL